MNGKMKQFGTVFLLAALLFVGVIVLVGCKKSEPAAPAETKEAASAVTEQTICPVMGNKIDKNIFTEYKGKRVYFCCASCKGEFEKDPEKYVAKLPQFNK
jgi:YHS domain-containing protein